MKILFSISALCILATGDVLAEDAISVRGSTVVAASVALASNAIKEEIGIEFKVVTEGGSSDAIYRMASGYVDVALSTHYMAAGEKSEHPEKIFHEMLIGRQVLAVVVNDVVWRSGVHALTKDQMRGIYEHEITNWKQVGGEDRELTYFNREVGHGVWDLFMIFLYGDARKAPNSKAEVLAESEDVRTTIEFNGGSISLIALPEAKGESLHVLGIKQADGTVIDPTPENITSGRYELNRPMLAITGRSLTGKLRKLFEFLVSEKGQTFVKKAGGVTLAEMKPAK